MNEAAETRPAIELVDYPASTIRTWTENDVVHLEQTVEGSAEPLPIFTMQKSERYLAAQAKAKFPDDYPDAKNFSPLSREMADPSPKDSPRVTFQPAHRSPK